MNSYLIDAVNQKLAAREWAVIQSFYWKKSVHFILCVRRAFGRPHDIDRKFHNKMQVQFLSDKPKQWDRRCNISLTVNMNETEKNEL